MNPAKLHIVYVKDEKDAKRYQYNHSSKQVPVGTAVGIFNKGQMFLFDNIWCYNTPCVYETFNQFKTYPAFNTPIIK